MCRIELNWTGGYSTDRHRDFNRMTNSINCDRDYRGGGGGGGGGGGCGARGVYVDELIMNLRDVETAVIRSGDYTDLL